MLGLVQWKVEISPLSNTADPARSVVDHVISLIFTACGVPTLQADITTLPVPATTESSETSHLFFFLWDNAERKMEGNGKTVAPRTRIPNLGMNIS